MLVPSRRELARQLSRFTEVNSALGLLHFFLGMAFYIAAVSGVLFLSALWMKIISSILAGWALGRLFSFAHNAAHECVVASKIGNRVLAFIAFTTFFYNYRLWVHEHHRMHHPYVNDAKPDAWRPFSKDEFDALPKWRQWLERFYRAPNVVGFGAYYILQRHFSTKLYPPRYVAREFRASAWLNFGFLVLYACAFMVFLLGAPSFAVNLTPESSLLLGLVLPLLTFEILDGFTLYVQHTDPRIPWFKDENVDREGDGRTELLSVHLIVPRWLGWFSHETYAHSVHHLLPSIPFYRVIAAQREFDLRLGAVAVVSKFGPRWWLDTMRRCKLYDWERRQWLDFDGNPTAPAFTRTYNAVSQNAPIRGDSTRMEASVSSVGLNVDDACFGG